MKITKFPQSCLLIETKGKRILIDPGILKYKEEYFDIWNNVDIILITHKHPDHCNVEVLKKLNKNITIYSTYGSLNGIDVIFDSEGSKVKAPSADFSEQTKEKQIQKSTSRTCPNCKGTGQVTFYATDNPWEQGTIDDCPMCHGTGKVTD